MKFALTLIAMTAAAYAEEPQFNGRKSVEGFWQGKGAPAHVAAAIADNVERESGFDPTRFGDGGSSLGLYQHHNERMRAVLATVENEQAFREVMGGDSIASAHWDEIKHASSRPEARRLWARYFERCKKCEAGAGTNQISSPIPPPALPPAPANPFSEPARTMPEMVFFSAKR